MAALKGTQPPGGSRKGIPNKMTKALKEMILGALDDAGGQHYLAEIAREQPAAFLTLLGKVLPTTLAGDKENPLQMVTRMEIVPVRPKHEE
jgi:hypothetical protein